MRISYKKLRNSVPKGCYNVIQLVQETNICFTEPPNLQLSKKMEGNTLIVQAFPSPAPLNKMLDNIGLDVCQTVNVVVSVEKSDFIAKVDFDEPPTLGQIDEALSYITPYLCISIYKAHYAKIARMGLYVIEGDIDKCLSIFEKEPKKEPKKVEEEEPKKEPFCRRQQNGNKQVKEEEVKEEEVKEEPKTFMRELCEILNKDVDPKGFFLGSPWGIAIMIVFTAVFIISISVLFLHWLSGWLFG